MNYDNFIFTKMPILKKIFQIVIIFVLSEYIAQVQIGLLRDDYLNGLFKISRESSLMPDIETGMTNGFIALSFALGVVMPNKGVFRYVGLALIAYAGVMALFNAWLWKYINYPPVGVAYLIYIPFVVLFFWLFFRKPAIKLAQQPLS
jgi:hypothetical protein